jgi:hypothetical protein
MQQIVQQPNPSGGRIALPEPDRGEHGSRLENIRQHGYPSRSLVGAANSAGRPSSAKTTERFISRMST